MIKRARSGRLARWAVLGSAAAMIAALVATTWSSYDSVRDASTTLAKGQGDQLLESVHRELGELRAPPTAAQLDEVRKAHADRGLRYLALILPHRTIESGTAVGEPLPPDGPGRLAMLSGGRVVRMEVPAPRPPRPPRPHGPPPLESRPPPHESRPPRGPGGPTVAIEFAPVVASALVADAERTRLIGGVAAVALALFALAMVRWLSRRELLEAQRERDARLAQLGEMSAVLAHEIRNPLASLKGHSQLLVERLDGAPEQPKAERVVAEAVRLERLTNDLLEFAKSGVLARDDASPTDVLSRAADDVAPDRIDVRADDAPAGWSLDAARMHQVLTNVLRNAVDASPNGERVTASCAVEDGALVYCVRDRGDGIAAGQEEAIFEPFRTTRTQGTGLGLAVARRLVELHGGRLTASNHPDGGAELRVEIPEAPR